VSGHFEAMGPFDWLFWCSTATNYHATTTNKLGTVELL